MRHTTDFESVSISEEIKHVEIDILKPSRRANASEISTDPLPLDAQYRTPDKLAVWLLLSPTAAPYRSSSDVKIEFVFRAWTCTCLCVWRNCSNI